MVYFGGKANDVCGNTGCFPPAPAAEVAFPGISGNDEENDAGCKLNVADLAFNADGASFMPKGEMEDNDDFDTCSVAALETASFEIGRRFEVQLGCGLVSDGFVEALTTDGPLDDISGTDGAMKELDSGGVDENSQDFAFLSTDTTELATDFSV